MSNKYYSMHVGSAHQNPDFLVQDRLNRLRSLLNKMWESHIIASTKTFVRFNDFAYTVLVPEGFLLAPVICQKKHKRVGG